MNKYMNFKFQKFARIFYLIKSSKKLYWLLGFIVLAAILIGFALLYLAYVVVGGLFTKINSGMPDMASLIKNIPAGWSGLESFVADKIGWFTDIFNKYSSFLK
jgi:hypothetical protein